ncbi:MAG: 2'-5' RNA ligase family protein [Acidobacteriia bacterium]|nr:2'-5' RNA ligase family protein [Terriglobia bacterium]
MCREANGTQNCVPAETGLNVFAFVIYLPDPLGRFLDDLRRELVPHYNPHAHVSVLPPRPLAVDWRVASEQLHALTQSWQPFDIELTQVDIFPETKVIYLELGRGAPEMIAMHAALNERCLNFREPFDYHPHVTLAQEVPYSEVETLYGTACRRWQDYSGPRQFRAERAVFVQNTLPNCWVDLAAYSLGVPALK